MDFAGSIGNTNCNDALVLGNNANVGIGISSPVSTFDLNGSMGMKCKSGQIAGTNNPDKSASLWIYSSGAGTITLPSAASFNGRMYVIVNQQAATVGINSFKNLSGANNILLAGASSVWLVSDGVNWNQIK